MESLVPKREFITGQGMLRLTRFENVQLTSMLVLQSRQDGGSTLTLDQAEGMIVDGKCDFLLRRRFTDDSTACFRVAANGSLEAVAKVVD